MQGFNKIITFLIPMLKTTIIDQNINNNNKCINQYKVNVRKKKLKKESKSFNKTDFYYYNAKIAFTKLKQTFMIMLIFCYFNPEYHIQIITHALGYAINEILNQLTLDNVG